MSSNQLQTLLTLENVSKTYKDKQALNNITVSFKKNSFNAIIGPSGAGKSTLVRCINGLIQPCEGRIIINDIEDRKSRVYRSHFAMVYQNFNLVPTLSVLRNVLVGRLSYLKGWRSISGKFSPKDNEIALKALNKVGIVGFAFTAVRNLSGGQQQRVAIARALAQEPKVLLADEPIASLDPKNAINIIELLKKIAAEENVTVIMNIHQIDLATKYFERIVGLKNGVLVFDSDKHGSFSQEHYRTVYEDD